MPTHFAAPVTALLVIAAAWGGAAAQERTVRIGTEASYAPWNLTNEAGEIVGFEIDLGNAICAYNNWQCEWVAQDWDGIFPALNQGRFDAIMSGVQYTEQRDEVMDFSIPYMDSPNRFATADPELAAALDDLGKDEILAAMAGRSIGLQIGTTSQAFLEDAVEDIDLRLYDTFDQLNLDVGAGRVEATFSDVLNLQDYNDGAERPLIVFGPDFMSGDHPAFGIGTVVAFREGDDSLQQGFNEAICALQRDGTIREFSLEWFATDVTVPCEQ